MKKDQFGSVENSAEIDKQAYSKSNDLFSLNL